MTVTRCFKVFGLSMEEVSSRLSDRLTDENPRLTLTAEQDEIAVLLSADADRSEKAAALCDEAAAFIRDRLGIFVYGEDVPDLQHRVVSLLLEKHKKIATAESCTAGLLSGKLTEVGGVSAVFDCGVASYSNEIKHSVLGVPKDTLETCGAVSEEVAAAMATGVRRISGADFGIGITGVAGPTPSEGKPVGTVLIALSDEKRVWVKKIERQNADREAVRLFAVMTALDLARRYLEALPGVMAGSLSLEKPSSETMPFPTGRVKKLRFWSPLFPSKSQGKAALFRAVALWSLILFLVAGTAFSAYYFIYRPLRNEQIYNHLESVYYTGLPETSTVLDTSLYPDGMLSRFYALYDQNADIRGFLHVDNTSIAYPVMDSRHSDYYATHDFLGVSSTYGVPYFAGGDFSSAEAAKNNRTLTIFGNREGEDQMFSPLLRYTDSAFYAAHEYISLNTLYSEDRYRVVAVCLVDDQDDFPYTNPPTESKDYAAFLKTTETLSLYTMPTTLSADSHLLFLSVADETEQNETRRLVVVAERLADGAAEPAYAVEQNPLAEQSENDTPAATSKHATATTSHPAATAHTTRETHPTTAKTTRKSTSPVTEPTVSTSAAFTTTAPTEPPQPPPISD